MAYCLVVTDNEESTLLSIKSSESFLKYHGCPVDILSQILYYKTQESSSPGESHPQALTDPDVSLSAHPAPIVQPFN